MSHQFYACVTKRLKLASQTRKRTPGPMSKDTVFWRQEGNTGSHFTPRLATDLSVSQVNARITLWVHIAKSASIRNDQTQGGKKDERGKWRWKWPHWSPGAAISVSQWTKSRVSGSRNTFFSCEQQHCSYGVKNSIGPIPLLQHHMQTSIIPTPLTPVPPVSSQSPHPLALVLNKTAQRLSVEWEFV